MSVQILVQGRLFGAREFLLAPVPTHLGRARQEALVTGRSHWISLLAEVLPRALIAELGPDEFLVMGFGSAVEFRPVQGSNYTAAQLVSNEQGVYENDVWRTTVEGQTAQGDYTGPIVNLPENGALVKVKLMKY